MRAVYLTVKYITIVGTFLQGFFEHLSCRMYDVVIEDGRYLRSNEMCGHIEHELIKKRGTAFGVCFVPFLFNLLIGLILTAAGSVNIFYLGEFFMSADSKVPNFPNFLFLWVGISCLTNLFPQIEDALTLKEQIYGKSKSNLFVKIIAAPIFAVLYVGSYLQSVGLTLVTSVVFSLFMPSILGTFIPQLYNAIAG